MARRKTAKASAKSQEGEGGVRCAPLTPLRRVRRRLVSPSGDVFVVDVPVYPPFRLRSEEERKASSG